MKNIQANRGIQAYEIMTKPVETVRMQDSLHEAARLFTDNHIGAAAVLDEHGKPVGVITKTDLVRYEEENDAVKTVDKKNFSRMNGESKRSGFHLVDEEDTIEHWMTPVIFSVKLETPMKEIARRMVRYGIHHIFVRGKNGEPIVGIVSSFDVLRRVAEEGVSVHA